MEPTPSAEVGPALSREDSGSCFSRQAPVVDVLHLHDNRIQFDNVYLNSLHALKRLEVRNNAGVPILVKLRSNLGTQVAFQLTNENLPRALVPQQAVEPPNTSAVASPLSESEPALGLKSVLRPATDAARFEVPRTSANGSVTSKSEAALSLLSHSTDSLPTSEAGAERADREYGDEDGTEDEDVFVDADEHLGESEGPDMLPSPDIVNMGGGTGHHFNSVAYGEHSHQYNQLFNYVNHIDEVGILPGKSQQIIIAFLPDDKSESRRRGDALEGDTAVETSDPETYDFFEVNGFIFLYVYLLGPRFVLESSLRPREVEGSPTESPSQNRVSWKTKGRPVLFSGSGMFSRKSSEDAPNWSGFWRGSGVTSKVLDDSLSLSPVSQDGTVASPAPVREIEPHDVQSAAPNKPRGVEYQCAIKFRSRVCRSVLWTDESAIAFDDCIVGGTYFRDFTIWNKSEIELYWCLNTVDLSSIPNFADTLRFYDYHSGRPLDLQHGENTTSPGVADSSRNLGASLSHKTVVLQPPISGFAHRRIRVVFRPNMVGDFNYDLQLENANDSSNVVECHLHATVRPAGSPAVEESLVVSSGNVLDFGDCCAGTWAKQQLVLRNIGEWPLEVKFVGPEDTGNTAGFSEAIDSVVFDLGAEPDDLDREPDDDDRGLVDFTVVQPSSVANTDVEPLVISTVDADLKTVAGLMSPLTSPSVDFSSWQSSKASRTSSRATSPTPSKKHSLQITAPLIPPPAHQEEPAPASGMPRSAAWSYQGAAEGVQRPRRSSGSRSDKPTVTRIGSGRGALTRIEELFLKPGTERTVQVSYRPRKDSSLNDYKAGKLVRRIFRIVLVYSPIKYTTFTDRNRHEESTDASTALSGRTQTTLMERKIIQCKARTCTSFVDIQPADGLINFGDTDVGVLKSHCMTIFNKSEIPAQVQLWFTSKILNAYRDVINIAPNKSVEVKLDIHPRKINPDYRKQIVIANLLNRENDKIVEVRAVNIDKHRITFHSLFYRVCTRENTNWLDFGSMVLNCPQVRALTIENISQTSALTLEVTTSLPAEVRVYRQVPAGERTLDRERERMKTRGRERQLDALTQQEQPSAFDQLPLELTAAAVGPGVLHIPKTEEQPGTDFSQAAKVVGRTAAADHPPPAAESSEEGAPLAATENAKQAGPGAAHAETSYSSAEAVQSAFSTSNIGEGIAQSAASDLPGLITKVGDPFTSSLPNSGHPAPVPGHGKRTASHHHEQSLLDSSSDYLDLASSSRDEGRRSPRRRGQHLERNPSRTAGKSIRKSLFNSSQISVSQEPEVSAEDRTPAELSLSNASQPSQQSPTGPFPHADDASTDVSDVAVEKPADTAARERPKPRPANGRRSEQRSESVGSLDALVSALETIFGAPPPPFPKMALEEQFVRGQLLMRSELDAAIQDGRLCPVETVDIAAASKCQLVLVFVPSSQRHAIEGKPRSLDAVVYIRLVSFDRGIQRPEFANLLNGDGSAIPVRELVVRSSVCRSMMDLGQKNINFGHVGSSERRQKRIVIRNRSETPLLYAIKKSGSIASGDLRFRDGRYGVIRGYAKREVEFTFKPTLAGAFHEHLTIENLRDHNNDQKISVKALIRKHANFAIRAADADFGPIFTPSGSCSLRTSLDIAITNTGKLVRMFEVRAEPQCLTFRWTTIDLEFMLETGDQGAVSKETLERIEVLEQKLKIAGRKGREDKVKKIKCKLARLRRGELEDPPVGEDQCDEDQQSGEAAEPGNADSPLPQCAGDEASQSHAAANPQAALMSASGGGVASLLETRTALSQSLPVDMHIASAAPAGSRTAGSSRRTSVARHTQGAGRPSAESAPVPAPKHKRTADGILFAVEGETTKAIRVLFSFIRDDSRDAEDGCGREGSPGPAPSEEHVSGQLLVHEHKNTDVCRKVRFQAVICSAEPTYRRLVEEARRRKAEADLQDAGDSDSAKPT